MPAPEHWLDVTDHPMVVHGWYAVMVCYDVDEGYFPAALNYVGKTSYEVTHRSAQTFETEKEAYDWAWAHDPDW